MRALVSRLRRGLGRRAYRVVDQVRPLPKDLGAFVAAPRSGVHGLRRAVDVALAKNDHEVALTGMLRLLAMGQLTTAQQRALRKLTADPGPTPVVPTPPRVRPVPAGSAYTSRLGLSFDRPSWSRLPVALRDQLGVCAGTRALATATGAAATADTATSTGESQ